MKNYQSITIHHNNVDDDDAQQNNIHLHLISASSIKNINNNEQSHLQEDHLIPPFNSPLRPSNIIVGAFNLTATIIGGGVLSLPIVFQKCGVLVTTVAVIPYIDEIFVEVCERHFGA